MDHHWSPLGGSDGSPRTFAISWTKLTTHNTVFKSREVSIVTLSMVTLYVAQTLKCSLCFGYFGFPNGCKVDSVIPSTSWDRTSNTWLSWYFAPNKPTANPHLAPRNDHPGQSDEWSLRSNRQRLWNASAARRLAQLGPRWRSLGLGGVPKIWLLYPKPLVFPLSITNLGWFGGTPHDLGNLHSLLLWLMEGPCWGPNCHERFDASLENATRLFTSVAHDNQERPMTSHDPMSHDFHEMSESSGDRYPLVPVGTGWYPLVDIVAGDFCSPSAGGAWGNSGAWARNSVNSVNLVWCGVPHLRQAGWQLVAQGQWRKAKAESPWHHSQT